MDMRGNSRARMKFPQHRNTAGRFIWLRD
jgi:hypothetical protein